MRDSRHCDNIRRVPGDLSDPVETPSVKRRVTIQTPLGEALQFHRLVGRETLSQAYVFEIDLLGSSNAIDPKTLLGKAATVAMETESGALRHLAGIVTRFGLSQQDARQSFYKMRLRPWLWLATRRSDFRIFQDQTVPDILAAVLGRYGHPLEQKLSRSYRTWNYCVQYHESDFDFVSRLCEHEGIYFWASLGAVLGLVGAVLVVASVVAIAIFKEDEWINWLTDCPLNKSKKPIHSGLKETLQKLSNVRAELQPAH